MAGQRWSRMIEAETERCRRREHSRQGGSCRERLVFRPTFSHEVDTACGDDPVYITDQLGHVAAEFSLSVYAKAAKRRTRLTGGPRAQSDSAVEWALRGTSEEPADWTNPAEPPPQPRESRIPKP